MSEGPRELTPIQSFFGIGAGIKNFSPEVIKVTDEEKEEVEAVLETAPKDVSVLASADSKDFRLTNAQRQSEIPVPTAESTLKELDEAAVKESGKLSELKEEELPSPTTTSPEPETSSPSSSSSTSPGWSMPPAPVKPPTSD